MNAQHVLPHIAAYRELDPTERSVVDQHIASCSTCAQAFAQSQDIDALLSSLPRIRSTAAQDRALHQQLVPPSHGSRPAVWGRVLTPQPQWTWLIVVVLVVALLSTTSVVAAQSLPDSPFYPLKLAAEQARSLVTVDPTAQAEWQLTLARTRLQEVTILVGRGTIPSVETLARLNQQFDRAVAATAQAPAAQTYRLLSAAGELNGLALQRFNAWLTTLPPAARPALTQTLAGVEANQTQVLNGLADPENFRLPAAPPSPTPTTTPTPTHTAAPTKTPTPPAGDTPLPHVTAQATATPPVDDTPTPMTPDPTVTPIRTRPPQPTNTATAEPVASPTAHATPIRRLRPTPSATPTAMGTVEPLPTPTPHATRTPRSWPTGEATPTPADSATPQATPPPGVTPGVTPVHTPPRIPPRRG